MHGITIYHSSDLNGTGGDNGEAYCVFIHNYNNAINSAWAWFDTKAEAEEFAANIKKKLKEEVA